MYKVLHVIDHTAEGGAQVVVGNIARALNGRFDFSVAVLGRSGRFSTSYREQGLQVHELGAGLARWNPCVAFRLWRTIKSVQPDVVHTHLFKSNVLGALVARAAGYPVIIHDHSGMTPATLVHYFNPVVRNVYLLAVRVALRASSRAIVLTPADAAAYRRCYGTMRDKVVVLPNSVDVAALEAASKGGASIRTALGLPAETRIVLMAGRLLEQKDWLTFIDVARKVGKHEDRLQCAFLIVGMGPMEGRIRREVSEGGVTNVHLLGYRDDGPQLLAQSDVCLLTSRRESFGLIVLEAMALGCPVVSTRCGGPESIIDDGRDGLLAPVGDAQALAESVLSILTDEDRAQQLATQGRQKVVRQFLSSDAYGRITDLYASVCGTLASPQG